jgi:predicted outer membrane repeat protein
LTSFKVELESIFSKNLAQSSGGAIYVLNSQISSTLEIVDKISV